MYNKLIDLEHPYHPGFYAYGTAGKNSRPPILSTRDLDDPFASAASSGPPDQLNLMVRLVPQKMSHSPMIHLWDQGKAHSPFALMDPDYFENPDFLRQGGFKSIDILYGGAGEAIYEGISHKFEGLQLSQHRLDLPQILYHHPFPCFEAEVLQQDYKQHADGYLVTPCPMANAWPRYPFGGFYDVHAPLDQIAPLYFSVGFDAKSRPQVIVETTGELTRAGVTPPASGEIHDQKIVFMISDANGQHLSLAESINQGHIRLELTGTGLDFKRPLYISSGYHQSYEGIWIYFELEKGY